MVTEVIVLSQPILYTMFGHRLNKNLYRSLVVVQIGIKKLYVNLNKKVVEYGLLNVFRVNGI